MMFARTFKKSSVRRVGDRWLLVSLKGEAEYRLVRM
jgi:hypothetical protein